MKRRAQRFGVLLLTALTLSLTAGGARAATTILDMRPMVFVLLDTSGSMEYYIEGAVGGAAMPVPDCPDPVPTGFVYQKNRWLAALEVLTGTVQDYGCSYDYRLDSTREDFAYPIPHVKWTWSAQNDDGLLDRLRDDISFSLMTFDSLARADKGASGGWSYYDEQPVGSLGTYLLDLGIKNASAGRGGLVHPTVTDTVADLRAVNNDIQTRVQAAIPHFGTPTGMALEDIALYMDIEPCMQTESDGVVGGDPFGDCRSRTVVLITDGRPNPDGQYGYRNAVDAAQRLQTTYDVKTYVIGFAVSEPLDLAALNAIADAGGTDHARIATSQVQLVGELGAVLGEVAEAVDSRSRPAFTIDTKNASDRQYRFWAARKTIEGNPVDRAGILEQEVWGCEASCRAEGNDADVDLCEIGDLGARLESQGADREIHSVVTDIAGGTATVVEIAEGTPELTADAFAIEQQDDYPQVAMFNDGVTTEMPFGHSIAELPGFSNADGSTPAARRDEYARQLIGYIRGDSDSRRRSADGTRFYPLGGIYDTKLLVQESPRSLMSSIPSYQWWANDLRERPTTLYVTTHDGLLHAFRVDRSDGSQGVPVLSESDYGREQWAFMPSFSLKRVQQLDAAYQQLSDGQPVIADVIPLRTDLTPDPADEKDEWRSYLVSSGGSKVRGLYALDVTDPRDWDDSMFRWEVTHEGRCWFEDKCQANDGTMTYERMGYQAAAPLLGNVFVADGSQTVSRAVVFVSGGQDPDGEGIGRVFYVLDAKTGEIIQEFSDANNNIGGTELLSDFPVTGTPVGYSTGVGRFVSRVFVGDDGGRLWRISLDSTSPSEWRMDLFHDAYEGLPIDDDKRAPIKETPSLAVTPTRGSLAVIYPTGDLDSDEDATSHTVYSLLEERTEGGKVRAKENWKLELPDGEVPIGNPIVFNSVAYFATYEESSNPCVTGTGRVWGLHYLWKDSDGNPYAAMDPDEDEMTMDIPVAYVEYPESIVLGIQVVREASCLLPPNFLSAGSQLPPSMLGDPAGSTPGMGGMQLVFQKTSALPGDSQSQPPVGAPGIQSSQIAKGSRSLGSTQNQVIFHTWARVFR